MVSGGCGLFAHNTSHRCWTISAVVFPPFHPKRSFHCQSRLPCEGIGQRARWWCWWLSNYPCWDYISRRCSKRPCLSAPNDHFTAGPDCRVIYRSVGALVVLVAVQLSVLGLYLPPVFIPAFHPKRSFHCQSRLPCDCSRPEGALVVLVAVQLFVLGLYLPPVFKVPAMCIRPKRSFHCRSRLPCERSGSGRFGGAGGCPTIRAGIVSAAGVRNR